LRQALFLTLVGALLAATAATAALTPTQYRAKVNAMCRSYTPKMKAQERAMTAAQKANKPQDYGVALGKLLVYTLQEDATLAEINPLIVTPDREVRALRVATRVPGDDRLDRELGQGLEPREDREGEALGDEELRGFRAPGDEKRRRENAGERPQGGQRRGSRRGHKSE